MTECICNTLAFLFLMQHSDPHVFMFHLVFFKLTHFYLQLIVLYEIANKYFQFLSSIQYDSRK